MSLRMCGVMEQAPMKGLHGGYHADKINNSPGNAASAYIAAGFLPVYPEGIYDLYALYELHHPMIGSRIRKILLMKEKYALHTSMDCTAIRGLIWARTIPLRLR